MKSSSTFSMKRLQTAKAAHHNLLLVAVSVLALNCTAAPMEADDTTIPNAVIRMAPHVPQSNPPMDLGDATTADAGILPSAGQLEPDVAAEVELDTLHHAAAIGDKASGLHLAQELVDRYATSGGNDHLYEAMPWIDRFHSPDLITHAPLFGHLASTQCTLRVVRYCRLCEKAEQARHNGGRRDARLA